MPTTTSSRRGRSVLRRLHVDTPPAQAEAYAFEAWEDDLYRLYGLGEDPAACPLCSFTGFFGPRFVEPDLRLRSCRFCGFWHEISEAPRRAIPVVHGCGEWPQVARAPYLWWVLPGVTSFACPFCGHQAEVAACRVTAPSHDPQHPWWKVPQRRDADYYRRFWENWSITKGRVVF